jgi:hypothetical protein
VGDNGYPLSLETCSFDSTRLMVVVHYLVCFLDAADFETGQLSE